MCIIMAKKEGVRFPSAKTIEVCCKNNPDGFALAWSHKGVVRNYRTLNVKEFIQKYKEVAKLDFKQTACIVHARIATHGSIRVSNTHCWIDRSTALAFAHNGILSIKNREDLTDSETFFQDIFLPIFMRGGWPAAKNAINACIGTSKFAFLHASGQMEVFGTYLDVNGVLYSNSSYVERTYTSYGSSSSNYYGRGGGYDSYRDGYYDVKARRYVYRGTETDAEWHKKKKDALENSYWDVEQYKYVHRTNETDDEWLQKKRDNEDLARSYGYELYWD